MNWEIIHIAEKPPSSLHETIVYVLDSAVDPKLANSLVRKLNQICPLETLRHVKRVRRRCIEAKIELSVIVCLLNGYENHMEGMSDDLVQVINAYNLSLFKVKVAKHAALSKEEWEEQCKYWPTSYHPPNDLGGITGFSKEDSQLSFDYMRVALRFAKMSCIAGKVVNAAVIVDPLSKQIFAAANDEACCSFTVNNTSLKGSNANGSVNVDDSVAKFLPNDISNPYTEVSCLYPWGWATQNPHKESSLVKCGSKCNSSWHPLRHAAMVAIGFDIYLVWEPCTMCAMALVHQRILRIFYAFPNPNAGALGSVYGLQGEKSLNHHYSVFRILVPEKTLHEE